MKRNVCYYIEVIAVFAAVTIIAAFSQTLVNMGNNIPVKMTITLLICGVIGVIPIAIYKFKKVPFKELGFNNNKIAKQILIGLGLSAVTVFCFVILPLFLGSSRSDVLSFKPSSVYVLVFYIIYYLIFVGFGEEIVFRGYFYNEIKKRTSSKLLAVILSSLMFGLWHYPNGFNIMKVLITSILGLIYGFSRYKVKNCTILSLGIAHGLHDSIILVLSYMI